MKTLSSSSQRRDGYRLAAENIIDLFEDFKFTTDNAVDYIQLVEMITDIIQNRIEGDVNLNDDDVLPNYSTIPRCPCMKDIPESSSPWYDK